MKRKSDFILQNVGGENLLVPLGAQVMNLNGLVTLNATGRCLWELLAQDRSVEDLAGALTETFDVEIRRARIVIGSIKKGDNAPALKAKGWIDADTTAFEGGIAGLATTDLTQETGKGDAKGATSQRNHNANALYDPLLTIQNAAGLQWPDDNPAHTGIRGKFRLSTFPPRGGNRGKAEQPPTPNPTPPTPSTPPAN